MAFSSTMQPENCVVIPTIGIDNATMMNPVTSEVFMHTSILVGLTTLFGLVMFYGSNQDWPVHYYLDPEQVKKLKRRWKKEFQSLESEMNRLDQLSTMEKEYVGQLKQFFIDELTIFLARANQMNGR